MNKSNNDLSPEKAQEIKLQFLNLQDAEGLHQLFKDLVKCLPLEPTEQTHCLYWLDLFIQKKHIPHYHYFTIKKASGRDRIIHSPDEILKLVQRLLNLILNCVFEGHPQSFGFKKGSSIMGNAIAHVGQNYVYNTDLSDFFTSINFNRVKNNLGQVPFLLTGEKEPLAEYISSLACVAQKKTILKDGIRKSIWDGFLPQGAPTSPILSNIVCYEMDVQLQALATKFKVNYTRYADDITFSSPKNFFLPGSRFLTLLEAIIRKHDFTINSAKSRVQRRSSRQGVTGLVVNEKVNVNAAFVKSLRMYFFFWERYGYAKAEFLFYNDNGLEQYTAGNKTLYGTIRGRLQFLAMVKGKENSTYQKLKKRWDKLTLPSGIVIQERERYFNAHKPKDVATFLSLFRDSSGLKYLTHEFDVPGREFNYEETMELAKKDFNTAFQAFSITRPLYARIKQFAFAENPLWWRWENGQKKEISLGWRSERVREWIRQYPGLHPFRQKSFRDDMIKPFKDSIQVRTPLLQKLLEDCLKQKFREDYAELNVSYENLESANFYTDVDLIFGGIRHLLDGILERLDVSKRITVKFSREDRGGESIKMIQIIHHDSVCFKDAEAEELLSGNFLEVIKLFTGLCNWSVTSRFNNGCFRLHLLKDSTGVPDLEAVEDTELTGFTHTLYFY